MRTFHKQLIILLVFFSVIFGLLIYYSFRGMNAAVEELTEQSATLLIGRFTPLVNSALNRVKFKNELTESQDIELRQLLLKESKSLENVEDLLLISTDGQIKFSLNSTLVESTYPVARFVDSSINNSHTQFRLAKREGSGVVDAVWLIDSTNNLQGVLRINSKTGKLRSILHDMTVKFYLIGFASILGVIFLALIGTRTLKLPLKHIETAMTVIDKRKYGFRLKWKSHDEFSEVYQKVNQALMRLEQLDSVQRTAVQRKNAVVKELKTISRFLDIMSHEIKNPLHALGINLDVLKTKIQKGQSKESALKHTEILEHEIEHLQKVIQGFLSYVRPGKPKKERIKINELIKGVCQTVAAEAEKSKIRIESRLSKGLREVLLDKGQIQQALYNIIINAMHATGEGGKISIRSWPKKKKILVSVKDNGAGISKEQLKKIFDLYYTTKKNGTGLGLPVTKRIIEANGGQIQLESKTEKGTKVTLMFPSL